MAAARASGSVGTIAYGARSTSAAAQIPSASILSSMAKYAAGRPDSTGLPPMGSSMVTNGLQCQAPRRSGSKDSMAARASGGRERASWSSARISSVTLAVGGGATSTTAHSSSFGTGPAPRAVITASAVPPSSRTHPTGSV